VYTAIIYIERAFPEAGMRKLQVEKRPTGHEEIDAIVRRHSGPEAV
jgi:hypothetical protein